MDWTAPLAVIGWLLVGCIGIGLVILALATVAAIQGVRAPGRVRPQPVQAETLVRQVEPHCPHCTPPESCPVLGSTH